MRETWKDVVGYEGHYQISNYGNVKSLDRMVRNKGDVTALLKGQPMSHFNNGKGYMVVSFCVRKRRKNFYVHRLVATAFIPNHENKRTVNHIDGDKANNNVNNIEWATYSENLIHATSVLRKRINEDSGNCKITDDDVIAMFEMFSTGNFSYYEIADTFNTKPDYVHKIIMRDKRVHVDIPKEILFKTRVIQAVKKGLTYIENKEWFLDFDIELKDCCLELWISLHNKNKGYMGIAKRNNVI